MTVRRRRQIIVLGCAWMVSGSAAGARKRRIGALGAAEWAANLRQALREFDWNAQDLEFVVRSVESNAQIQQAADQLVRSGVEILVTDGTPAARALRNATATIPIVASLNDPVGAGLARSLSAPGGNMTGLAYAAGPDTNSKLFQLARAVLPRLARVSMFHYEEYRLPADQVATWRAAAQAQGLRFENHPMSARKDFLDGLDALRGPPTGAALLLNLGSTAAEWVPIVREATARHVPTFSPYASHSEGGGLLSYMLVWGAKLDGSAYGEEVRRFASIVDKVLRGADPARIPFELPSRSRLVVNLRAARALGIAVAGEVLLRADTVIE